MTIRLKSLRHTGSRLSLVRIASRRFSTCRGPAAAHTKAPTRVALQHRCQAMRSSYDWYQGPRRSAQRSCCGPPRIAHHGPDRRTQRAGNPDSTADEMSRFGEKPVLDVGSQSVNVTVSESTIPTLRTQRPQPCDRGKHALTWGFALNTSHRFAAFRARCAHGCVASTRYDQRGWYAPLPWWTRRMRTICSSWKIS